MINPCYGTRQNQPSSYKRRTQYAIKMYLNQRINILCFAKQTQTMNHPLTSFADHFFCRLGGMGGGPVVNSILNIVIVKKTVAMEINNNCLHRAADKADRRLNPEKNIQFEKA